MRNVFIIMLACMMSFFTIGCQGTAADGQKALERSVYSDSAALAFALSNQDWCSNDQACSLVIQMLDGKDAFEDFAQRVESLQGRGIACEAWKLAPDAPVTKGTLAYMVCKALNIKGGLMFHLVPSRRYAYLEAVDRDLMAAGSEDEILTGPEAVGIMGRASRLRNTTNNTTDHTASI